YGEAVNTAKSLSDMSGDDQILICGQVAAALPQNKGIRTRALGPMHIRGKSAAVSVSRIEWQTAAAATDFMTMPADLSALTLPTKRAAPDVMTLSWLKTTQAFKISERPIYIGRHTDANFVVDHPRVSRMHARIFNRHNTLILEDLSTYGTWVRFAGGSGLVTLRREECALTGMCEITLGGPPDPHGYPTLRLLLKAGVTS
ncbi:MAG: FHA domain-containing protein, partial [Hylemonella sp.]|nr:FHA domain-containing protein [Hylemonella sp.]